MVKIHHHPIDITIGPVWIEPDEAKDGGEELKEVLAAKRFFEILNDIGGVTELPMPEEPKPQYKWVLTWPGEAEHDFVGYDGVQLVGRIYRVDHSPLSGKWKWQVGRIQAVRERVIPHNGWADTARQAAAKAEQNYRQTISGSRRTSAPVNS